MDRTQLLSLIHAIADRMEFVSIDLVRAADGIEDTETLERLIIILAANLKAESELSAEDRERLSGIRQEFVDGMEAIYRSEYLALIDRVEQQRDRAPEILQKCLSEFAFL